MGRLEEKGAVTRNSQAEWKGNLAGTDIHVVATLRS
jgi:hypothetical protein